MKHECEIEIVLEKEIWCTTLLEHGVLSAWLLLAFHSLLFGGGLSWQSLLTDSYANLPPVLRCFLQLLNGRKEIVNIFCITYAIDCSVVTLRRVCNTSVLLLLAALANNHQ